MKTIQIEDIDFYDPPLSHAIVTFSSGADRFIAFFERCYYPVGVTFEGAGEFKLDIAGRIENLKKISERPMEISITNSDGGVRAHFVVGKVIDRDTLSIV